MCRSFVAMALLALSVVPVMAVASCSEFGAADNASVPDAPLGGRELEVSFPIITEAGTIGANLAKTVSTVVSDIHLSFLFTLGTRPQSGSVQLMTLFIAPTNSSSSFASMLIAKPNAVVI